MAPRGRAGASEGAAGAGPPAALAAAADAALAAADACARFMRADSLPTWRPVERTPRLSPVLASAIAHRPAVLVVNLGAWEFEDGCNDMHSLHDALCNVTRPWILREYASKWLLVAAALRASHRRAPGRGGVVVWRGATPRDFEGGVAKQGGRCRRRQPMRGAELASAERELNPASMRFAVLSKNVIMDAVAAQAAPHVHVLDAYALARQRADAHPGPDPKTNRHGSLHPKAYDDCLHYCLPGVPDLYNGRLLTLLERATSGGGGAAAGRTPVETAAAAAAAPPPATEGVPGALLARWNFEFGGGRFVQGSPATGGYRLQLERHAPPVALECPLPSARGGPYPPAAAAGGGGGGGGGAADEPRAGAPLLGFCSALDPPAAFAADERARGGKTQLKSSLKSEAGKAKRKSMAELLTRKERGEIKATRRNATGAAAGASAAAGAAPSLLAGMMSRMVG